MPPHFQLGAHRAGPQSGNAQNPNDGKTVRFDGTGRTWSTDRSTHHTNNTR